MEVFANGKNISTYPFGNLFVQGEKFADTLIISLERFYNNSDISDYKFMVVGLTEDDYEINQIIMPESINEKFIKLKWNVSGDFTAHSGKLRLELRTFKETDGEINIIIKYDMPTVNVKPTINGINEPLPDTNEQFINSITVVTAECLEQLQSSIDSAKADISEQIQNMNSANADCLELLQSSINSANVYIFEQIQNSVNSANVTLQDSINNFNVWVQGQINSFNLDETKKRLDKIESDTAVYLARPEVIPVTRSQYNSTKYKKNALYVITGEE